MTSRAWIGAACFAVACSSSSRPPPAGTDGLTDSGAALDGGPTGDAGGGRRPGTWCADHRHDVCEDFDDPSSPVVLPPRGALESSTVVSAPNAFVAKTPAFAANAGDTVQLQLSSAKPPDGQGQVEADFAFDVRVQAEASGRFEIARVSGVNPIDFRDYGFALVVTAGAASIELRPGSKAPETKPLARAPAPGTWVRVSIHLGMHVVVNGPATSIAVQIGDGAPETFSLDAGMGVRPFLYLGTKVTGPADAFEVDYDDVTYDLR